MNIYRDNILLTSVAPESSSVLRQRKNEYDFIQLDFFVDTYVDLQIGDRIYFSKTNSFYTLNSKPNVSSTPRNYRYSCRFEGALHEFEKVQVFLDTVTETKTYRDYSFSLTGTAETFLHFIIENLERAGYSYEIGAYETTEPVTIQFNNWNVREAINEITGTLGIEWCMVGDTLHFKKVSSELAYVFMVGRYNGFTSLERTRLQSKELYTVVYGYGGTQNLPPRESYDSTTLFENRLMFAGVDGESKLTNNIELYGRRETVQEFPDIIPEYTGTVQTLSSLYTFTDTGIDFDINEQLIPGLEPKVTFLSGSLMGLSFGITVADGNTITLTPITEESGTYPNATIKMTVGDTYKIYDIQMPDSYIVAAQNRLQQATQDFLDDYSTPADVYTAQVDEEYLRINEIELSLGIMIRIVNEEFGIDNMYEIKDLQRNINNEYKYTIGFGEKMPSGLISSIKNNNFTQKQTIYNINRTMVTSNEVTNIIGGETPTWEQL